MHTHSIRKQPITLRNGKLTTIGLEPEFFRALRLIAYSRSLSAADLIRNIEAQPRPWKQTFTSTLRCFVVRKKGERIRIAGLGILQVRKRPARMGRNPATGEAIKIGASKKVAFRASKELKEAI